jgi:predicted metalloendopeptidase
LWQAEVWCTDERNAYFGCTQVVIAYKRYLKDMVQLLGATSTDASSFAEEMFHFEKRIAEITPSLDELQDPATTYNRITLDALKSYAQSVSGPIYPHGSQRSMRAPSRSKLTASQFKTSSPRYCVRL